MKRSVSLILALVMLLVLLAGCAPSQQSPTDSPGKNQPGTSSPAAGEKKFYRIATNKDYETCDVQMTTADYTIPLNIYDRLVEIAMVGDGLSEIVPGLATEWKVSDDGLVYTFKLRENVKFHNGEIFKADDVKYTFERMLNPAQNARNSDALTPILGAAAMLDGTATELTGLKIINDYEIEVTLEEAYAPFLANIATPAGSIYNRKATEAAGLEFGVNPAKTCGTGPYYLSEWVLNDHSLIEAFDGYWNGRPKNDGVLIKVVPDQEAYRMMFENDELDELDFDMARTQIPYFTTSEKWKDHIVYGNRVGVYYYHINQSIKPFDDLRIRKAFQMSIDREGLLASPLYNGTGFVHNGIMAKGLIGYNPDLPEIKYDPEGAKALMAEAGYPNGFDMTITQTTESPNTLALNEYVQAMLKEVGINAEIKQMDEATWYDVRAKGELASYTTSWSADFNDPDNFFYTFFTPVNSVRRSYNYKNEEAMARVEAARYMSDPEARIKEYQELEKLIIQDDAAWVPLFQLQHLWVLQPRVKDFVPLWNGWTGCYYAQIQLIDG